MPFELTSTASKMSKYEDIEFALKIAIVNLEAASAMTKELKGEDAEQREFAIVSRGILRGELKSGCLQNITSRFYSY